MNEYQLIKSIVAVTMGITFLIFFAGVCTDLFAKANDKLNEDDNE